MPKRLPTGERKTQILQTLARMLESEPNSKVTTSALAKELKISEATLYRHFSSKADMLENLLAFAEDTVFSLIKQINQNVATPHDQIKQIIIMLQSFAQKNPGISKLIIGNNLIGEKSYLRDRATQFFRRLETQLKQILRLGQAEHKINPGLNTAVISNLITNIIIGQWHQFVNSKFKLLPTEYIDSQWQQIRKLLD